MVLHTFAALPAIGEALVAVPDEPAVPGQALARLRGGARIAPVDLILP